MVFISLVLGQLLQSMPETINDFVEKHSRLSKHDSTSNFMEHNNSLTCKYNQCFYMILFYINLNMCTSRQNGSVRVRVHVFIVVKRSNCNIGQSQKRCMY